MKKEKYRRICLVAILSVLLTLMQIAGWQASMKNGTSMHSSPFFQNIGQMKVWQCALWGIVEFLIFGVLIYRAFTGLEKHCADSVNGSSGVGVIQPYLWIGTGFLLYGIYILYLIGCYPGFYNYDAGNQIPQFLYAEVPYSAHHPILHTLLEGGIISLGYKLRGVDLTFGVFLYCAFQMAVCAVIFTYCIFYIYQYTYKKRTAVAAFLFYAMCPPVIMFAMCTTKDVICYTVLLAAILKMSGIYRDLQKEPVRVNRWIQLGGLLVIACLFRKNIIYVVVLFAVLVLLFVRKERKKQLLVYACVVLTAFLIDRGLIFITNASEGSPMEAFSIPVQQIARLYRDKGEEAFDKEELEILYSFVDREMLSNYDPFISDSMKYAFWLHYDVISENWGAFWGLWVQKGLQYPLIYIEAFVDNTYQSWYPCTVLHDTKGFRYFDITEWQKEYGRPRMPWLYNFYCKIYREASYLKYPVLRMFFSIGFMLWTVLAAWFYGLWKRDRSILTALGFVLCISVTNLAGPVSDIRYYLLQFYAFPFCIAIFAGKRQGVGYVEDEKDYVDAKG